MAITFVFSAFFCLEIPTIFAIHKSPAFVGFLPPCHSVAAIFIFALDFKIAATVTPTLAKRGLMTDVLSPYSRRTSFSDNFCTSSIALSSFFLLARRRLIRSSMALDLRRGTMSGFRTFFTTFGHHFFLGAFFLAFGIG